MTVLRIEMKELRDQMGTLGAKDLILDVRGPDEYASGHVPGSRNIPLPLLATNLEELKDFRRIFVHCQAGGRAGRAAEILLQAGIGQVVCVSGSGMRDWIAAGFPVESGHD
jgi:rhodanese-related sulfurtransferase